MGKAEDDYVASIEISATPEASFEAVARGMSKWWTETTEGALNEVGDRVKVIFPPDFGYWIFEATRLEAGAVIEMACIDAHHRVEGQPEAIDREWLGTTIVWHFAPVGSKTRVTLIHRGLTPQLKCWDICLDGWNHFFKGSLRGFLEGGAATPHRAA